MDSLPQSASGAPLIRPSRKILCISALALGALLRGSPRPRRGSAPPPSPSRAARRTPASPRPGGSLIFTVRDRAARWRWRSSTAAPDRAAPARATSASTLRRPGGRGAAAALPRRRAKPTRRVGLELLDASGKRRSSRTVAGEVKRPSPRKLVVALVPGRSRPRPAPLRAGASLESRRLRGRAAAAPTPCPRGGTRVFRLRPVRAVGCTGGSAGLVTNGPRDRKVVALTFDDGPSEYTAGFLDVLREKHVDGDLLRDRPGDAGPRGDDAPDPRRRQRDRQPHDAPRRIPRLRGDRRRRQRAIEALHPLQALPLPPARRRRRLGGDRRPPASLGMRTITWDVDPRDWSNPGSGAIYSRRRRRTPSPARSSSCTTAAAPAARPWRRCRGSSTPCAAAATASPRSPNCSATD